MDNKYQEALDYLMSLPVKDINKAPTFCRIKLGDYTEIGGVNIEMCRNTLQELIEHHQIVLQQCEDLDAMLKESNKRNAELKKALDIACKAYDKKAGKEKKNG